MTWILAASGLALAGLAVLAVIGLRVVAAARRLRSEVARAQERISPVEQRLRGQIRMNKTAKG
ncbi:hypothetical protein [Nonomuraea longicatena]|uniref:DUF948 domain-containing protein n=1 Tax=Nonomuraea longicatena TaxID=83682 RepID=A0ABP3ZC59_9ACTN